MARIRTIKPDFWTDGNIVALSPFARLLYIGMWNFTMCDHGHVADDAMKLKLQVLPMDDIDIVALLSELLDSERVTRVVDPEGRTYLHVTRFEDHQKIDPRWKTRCSACTHRDSLILAETHPSLDVAHPNSPKLTLGRDGKGRDGKGKDKETAPRKRGARLSDDWNPSESLNAAMTEERPDIDLTAELRIFRDYWIAQPGQRGVKTDWDATWRNWIRRARPTVRPGAQQNGISRQDAKVNGYLAYANLDNQKEIS